MTVRSTNERVLELFRELNCLAEIDSDAAFIVNTYRAGLGHVRPRHLGRITSIGSQPLCADCDRPSVCQIILNGSRPCDRLRCVSCGESRHNLLLGVLTSTPRCQPCSAKYRSRQSQARVGGAAASTPVSKTGDVGSSPARPAMMVRDSYWPGGVPLSDNVIEQMALMPRTWEPDNPDYVKSHVNAPGTVRSWFRKLRAADFARDTAMAPLYGGGLVLRSELQARWTLFDSQQLGDRETAHVYQAPTFTFWLVPNGPMLLSVSPEMFRKWLQEKWDESVREVHGNDR